MKDPLLLGLLEEPVSSPVSLLYSAERDVRAVAKDDERVFTCEQARKERKHSGLRSSSGKRRVHGHRSPSGGNLRSNKVSQPPLGCLLCSCDHDLSSRGVCIWLVEVTWVFKPIKLYGRYSSELRRNVLRGQCLSCKSSRCSDTVVVVTDVQIRFNLLRSRTAIDRVTTVISLQTADTSRIHLVSFGLHLARHARQIFLDWILSFALRDGSFQTFRIVAVGVRSYNKERNNF